MRSLLVACAVLGLAVALLARSVSAEPPPPTEPREISKIVEALEKKPGSKSELASVRFYAEVFAQKSMQAPIGSPLETLGPWGDNGALLGSENQIAARACGALTAKELEAASAILKAYGESVPLTLRAFTLGHQGKKTEAAALFRSFIDKEKTVAACPSEHPMYSHRRTSRLSFALQCLKVFAPGKDVSAQQKVLERAESCAMNNHAVG
ncbi:MAG: hypothetical protein Q8K32_34790 [Archangium sp.]|nr:hypothetical protein [Archangium sp.]